MLSTHQNIPNSQERRWQFTGQEHQDKTLYMRYHKDIYMPEHILADARAFLPDKGTILPLSPHYNMVQKQRGLPVSIRMPGVFDIVDVSIVRAAGVVFRVLIRTPWTKRTDLALVLEGDYEVVTAFWIKARDRHATLDHDAYESLIEPTLEPTLER